MPLKNWAKKTKSSMQKTYGKAKGTRVFYAWANKHGKKPDKGK